MCQYILQTLVKLPLGPLILRSK